MLLRAFVCARNVRDGNDDGLKLLKKRNLTCLVSGENLEKKRMVRERGYFIYLERIFLCIFVNQNCLLCTGNLVILEERKELL